MVEKVAEFGSISLQAACRLDEDALTPSRRQCVDLQGMVLRLSVKRVA